MVRVGVHEAKSTLSELLRRAGTGEDVTITRGGEPIARLVAVPRGASRQLGRDRGLVDIPENFDEPLPEDVLADFER